MTDKELHLWEVSLCSLIHHTIEIEATDYDELQEKIREMKSAGELKLLFSFPEDTTLLEKNMDIVETHGPIFIHPNDRKPME